MTDATTPQPVDERWAARPDWNDDVTLLTWVKKPASASMDATWGQRLEKSRFNLGYNAVDRHIIDGRIDEAALVFGDETGAPSRTLSFAHLVQETGQFSGVLQALDTSAGQNLLIAMPICAESVIAYLGALRLGVAVALIDPTTADGQELRDVIQTQKSHVVLTSSSGGEGDPLTSVRSALRDVEHQPLRSLVVQDESPANPLGDDELAWADIMKPGVVQPAGWRPLIGTVRHTPDASNDIPRWSATLAVALRGAFTGQSQAEEATNGAWCWAHGGDWSQAALMNVLVPMLSGVPAVVCATAVGTWSDAIRREVSATIGRPLYAAHPEGVWPLNP
ncbi:AMP-binding protein [Ornithinimicrobium sp. Arc0846-15]|nr:AMP-binding protein [Ornithinimicrobium laminariae]